VKTIGVRVVVHREEGSLWAEVPSCPGLFASGETREELDEALCEAWLLYHDDDDSDQDDADA
jgi:predicted RNase H-like HicB family nuclease